MTKIEESVAKLEAFRESMQEQIKDLGKRVDVGFEGINSRLDKIEERNEANYAKKWVERGLVWFMASLGVAIIGFVVWVIQTVFD